MVFYDFLCTFQNATLHVLEFLKIKKVFWNKSFDYQTRALISFKGPEFTKVSQSVVNGDIADAKEPVEFDFSAGLFLSFAAGGGFYCFSIFHEAGGEGPQPITGFDCPTTE